MEEIKGHFEKIKESLGPLWDVLEPIFDGIKDFVSNTNFGEYMDAVGEAIGKAAEAVGWFVTTMSGFLGAGAIIRQGLNVRGLTSAAVIWTAAAIGLACGIGQYFISFITVILAMVCLGILEKLEYRLCPAEKSKKLIIVYENHSVDIELVQKEIIDAGLYKRDLNMSESIEKERIELIFSVKAPENFNMGHLTKRLMKLGKIIKISITDD